MPSVSILYVEYLSLSIGISAITALLFWQRRAAVGAKAMSLCMIFVVQWTLCDLLATLTNEMAAKIFWDSLAYLGVVIIPVVWLIFSLQYTNQEKHIIPSNLVLISIIPALTLLAIWTNDFHHLT